MRRRGAAAALLAMVLATTLAACSDPDRNAANAGGPAPFRVVAILPVTGPLSSQSTLQVNGLNAAAEVLNKNGGIGGRQVSVTVLDDKLDPTEAVTLLQGELNSAAPPDYVWAGATSNEARALLPALTAAGILSGTTASDLAMNDPQQYPYHFGLQQAANQNFRDMLGVIKAEGVKTLGFISANDALGTYGLKAMEEQVKGSGIRLVTQSYDTVATDVTAPMDALRAEDPDLVVMSAYGPAVGYLLDARQKLQWDVPVIGDMGLSGSNPAAIVDGAALAGVRLQAPVIASVADSGSWLPSTQAMIGALRAQGDISQIITLGSLPYDALHVLALAAEQAGSTDADSMRAALESLEVPARVPWTSYPEFGYSADNHFPVIHPGYLVYPEATLLVDGQFK